MIMFREETNMFKKYLAVLAMPTGLFFVFIIPLSGSLNRFSVRDERS